MLEGEHRLRRRFLLCNGVRRLTTTGLIKLVTTGETKFLTSGGGDGGGGGDGDGDGGDSFMAVVGQDICVTFVHFVALRFH
jgi:hypothetical protein